MMGRPPRMALQIMIDRHGLVDDTIERLAAESMKSSRDCSKEAGADAGAGRAADGAGEAKIPKAVATSSTRAFMDDVLGRFDFHPRFEFILTSEDVVHGKPHPEIYLTAVRPAELRRAKCWCWKTATTAARPPPPPARSPSPSPPAAAKARLLDGLAGHRFAGGPAAVWRLGLKEGNREN